MANRQEIVCDYIQENLVQFGRLRHDVVSNKIQVNEQRDYLSNTHTRVCELKRKGVRRPPATHRRCP